MELSLGTNMQSLFEDFIRVDSVYCFLKKSKSGTNINSIKMVYESLFGASSFDLNNLRILCILNSFMSLNTCFINPENLVFEYTKANMGPSEDRANRRKHLCRDNLIKYLKKYHDDVIKGKWNALKQGWHASFDVNSVPLPVIPSTSHDGIDDTLTLCKKCPSEQPLNSNLTNILSLIASTDVDNTTAILDGLKQIYFYRTQICYARLIKGSTADYADLLISLHPDLHAALSANKIYRLYSHQCQGIHALHSGRHVVVTTSTASGKSIIYNIPVINTMLLNTNARALYMFPTKALAHDQLKGISKILTHISAPPIVSAYDGDASFSEKDIMRQRSHILLTNADSIHHSILPNHKKWSEYFMNIKYVVIDEAHIYRGGFGTHVAMILRRFIRICLLYNSHPQIVCCSASIANPLQLLNALLPIDALGGLYNVEIVDRDGSPQGNRFIAVWNPLNTDNEVDQSEGVDFCSVSKSPTKKRQESELLLSTIMKKRKGLQHSTPRKDKDVPGFLKGCEDKVVSFPDEIRARVKWRGSKYMNACNGYEHDHAPLSIEAYLKDPAASAEAVKEHSYNESARLLIQLTLLPLRVLFFCQSRNAVERIVTISLSEGRSIAPIFDQSSIAGYRAGYSSESRRSIERSLVGGDLKGIVATNALEIGVDIGNLNATIQLGYPGSKMSFWQQIGRAGRGGQPSLSILVCTRTPSDQFIAKNASLLFGSKKDSVYINTMSPQALRNHLLCAAYELPLNYVFDSSNPSISDNLIWGISFQDTVQSMFCEGLLLFTSVNALGEKLFKYRPANELAPSRLVSIRQMGADDFIIIDESNGNKQIDSMEKFRAFKDAFVGSVLINQGRQYLVREMNLESRRVYCSEQKLDYRTSSECSLSLAITKVIETNGVMSFGTVSQRYWNWTYRKIKNSRVLSEHDCHLPDIEMTTPAVWVLLTDKLIREFNLYISNLLDDLLGAIHTLSHALISVASTVSQCSSTELQSEHEYSEGFPHRILLYEMKPEGIGIAESLFIESTELFDRAAILLRTCSCSSGCFSCVLDYRCWMNVDFYNKRNALELLGLLINEHASTCK